jgi:glucosamine-6-phosphate deaminase
MKVTITHDPEELGVVAAQDIAQGLASAIAANGRARLVLSTGRSQFETLAVLVRLPVEWHRVEIFHLDEYLGLSEQHPASFRRYLRERVLQWIDPASVHLIDPASAPSVERVLEELTAQIREEPIDVAVIGIGENGHIAFNDPPADMSTRAAYKVVDLDTQCRLQQVHEGWFASLEEVPKQAITMTVYQILQARHIVCPVPHAVKAQAIRDTLTNTTTSVIPATALWQHQDVHVYLDTASASGLDAEQQRRITLAEKLTPLL